MFKLQSFELKKIFKKKRLLYLLIIIAIFSLYQFTNNASQQDQLVDQLYEKTETLYNEVNFIDRDLDEKRLKNQLDDLGLERSNYIKEMKSALSRWRSAIYYEEFNDIPKFEREFLQSLQAYLNTGEEFEPLDGLSFEYALQKNAWMIEHDLAIEDETYPVSPHLFLKESSKWLFGILGIIILLLCFGDILSAEREQHTWLTLKTQPITNFKIFFSKYFALLIGLLFYIFFTIFIGVFVPIILGDHQLILNYPQAFVVGDEVAIISTLHYLLLKIMLLIVAALISFSLIFLVSKLFKSTFSTLMTSFFVLLIGYLLTESVSLLQTPINIFQHLRLDQIILEQVNLIDWKYPVFAILWSAIILVIASVLPERVGKHIHFNTTRKAFNSGETNSKRGKLWNVVIFEFRKLFRKGNLIQGLIILLLLISIGYYFLYQFEVAKEKEYFDYLNEELTAIQNGLIPMFEDSLGNFTMEMENTSDELQKEALQEYIEGYTEAIHLYETRMNKINEGIEGYQLGKWAPLYEHQLFQVKLMNGDFDEPLKHISHGEATKNEFRYYVSVEEKKWLIEKDIQPIFSGDYRLTMHDEWPDYPINEMGRRNYEKRNQNVNASGLYSLYHYYEFYIYVIPLLLFLFLLGTSISSERGKKNTIFYMQTQPISSRTIFLGKTISSSLVAFASILGLVSFILLLGTVFNRFGDWNYPVLHYDTLSTSTAENYTGIITDYHDYGFHFIPLGNYLIQCLVLLLLVTLFMIALGNVISLFVKNTFTVLLLSIVINIFGYIMSVEHLSQWSYLSPFTYFDIFRVSNGEVATLFDQPLINSYMGFFILIISTLLLVMIGYFKSRRKGV